MGHKPASHENNNWPGTMHDNAAGEATKKQPASGRLLFVSATYFQGLAMAAAGEWRDEVGCSKLSSVSLEHAVH